MVDATHSIASSDVASEEEKYIWQQPDWPHWRFDNHALAPALADVQQAHIDLFARMEKLSAAQRKRATLHFLTEDVVSTSAIEGEQINFEAVRASIAHHLGLDIESPAACDPYIEGVVQMVLDATLHYAQPLTPKRLFTWHDALFPSSFGMLSAITTESWRDDAIGPMQVVSGPIGQQKVHFQAPSAQHVNTAMGNFLRWFNAPATTNPIIKAGLAQLWFLTVHPFGDGNGRIARVLNDMALARAHGVAQRFYSYSAQILCERKAYFAILEKTQKGDLDVTEWLQWFLEGLNKSIHSYSIDNGA